MVCFMKFISGGDLRSLRIMAKLTTVDMAEAAGVEKHEIYESWEAEKESPNIDQLIALARACGLTCADTIAFFMDKGEPKGPHEEF